MTQKRKQVVVDRKFQYTIAIKAMLLPLLSMLLISSVLIYFAVKNNSTMSAINRNQAEIIDTFLAVPQLMDPRNPITENANVKFRDNLGMSYQMQRNNRIVLYFLIAMTVVQSIAIFTIALFLTHKISGPMFVMMSHLRNLKEGKNPDIRPLRKNDEFKEFYAEFCDMLEMLSKREK
jgi:nitrogen fixation/metabolism regulation signal transduction histidine kinase